jgi:hypothetical protein
MVPYGTTQPVTLSTGAWLPLACHQPRSQICCSPTPKSATTLGLVWRNRLCFFKPLTVGIVTEDNSDHWVGMVVSACDPSYSGDGGESWPGASLCEKGSLNLKKYLGQKGLWLKG